jgi:predicted ATPase/class 3 adenylate cyclase
LGVQLSSGAITMLFTDIEGSTGLWEKEGERMAAALARHDALALAAVEGNRGLIWKSTGDGIYAAFDDPLDALNATLAFQRLLGDPAATHGIPIRVRCGLHLGAVERRDKDYFGAPVNRAGQIMSAGHGGQVLLSRAVVDALGERLPSGVSLRDLGRVRLKDLTTPEHIYQVLHPQLRQDFPPLRSLEATPNNLPQQTTSFVGREREVAQAKERLHQTRLLTLLGMGGLGKTRLAMQIGADLMTAYPDGIWFVDLAPIVDPALVPSTTAQVLGVREEPGRTLTETLCAHLKPQKLILILDNCEHVVGACGQMVDALLRETPEIRVIATSREALRVQGEQTYPVYPLALPDRNASLETLARSEAVQLFMERARLQKPGFSLTERDAPAVAEICTRLEGIPLAMELAAARMRSLSVQDINTRLKDRFKLLTGGSRVALERQQTLRALVAWSYDLLQETEQRLLERLGVFAGGFDLESTKAICGTEPLAPDNLPELLSSLVDKSLVMADDSESRSRYRMLETLRDYARDRLIQREELAATAIRHCNHYFVMAKAANKGLQGPEQAEWTRRLEAEHDNLRAAIALALEKGTDPVIAVKIEVALMGFWLLCGYSTEGRRYVSAALALPEVLASDVAHAHALYTGAVLADNQSDYAEARRMLNACLLLRRNIANPFDTATTLSTLSHVRLNEGDAEGARSSEEEALQIFRQIGDRTGEAIGLFHLGEICVYVSDDVKARECFEQSLSTARAIDHLELEGECELLLGQLALDEGDLGAARARFTRSLEVCRNAENKRGEAIALWWTGKAEAAGGDGEAARVKLGAALRALQAFEMNAEVLACLEDHAELMHALGPTDEGVRLFATVEMLRERLRLSLPPRREKRRRHSIAAAHAALGDAAFDAAWSEGREWELEQATRRALARATKEAATV